MEDAALAAAAGALVRAGQRMDRHGWVPATAGNLSVRLDEERVAITRSGPHKGLLDIADIMVVDLQGTPLTPGRPSAETGLHCGVYRRFPEAGAVLHGHSVPATVLTRRGAASVRLRDYELLKAWPGLPTHAAAVELPVFDNDQDIGALQSVVDRWWDGVPEPPPGYLIRGHGIYVWAPNLLAALTRLEALEFMLACEVQEMRG